ncbi:MAG: aminopeptidase P family protein [Bacteroidaceae bacterium]|nr:aminopeptidase P family protein [Bacteroidaceae bacterium]
MNPKIICERVEKLRAFLREHQLDAYIFPSTDPHCGEYIPDHWMTREWISGFNGSAGTAVVTLQDAALWTDSRYFLAASEQLEGTPFQLMKLKIPGTPSIAEWLGQVLPKNSIVGMDGWVNTIADIRGMKEELEFQGLKLELGNDPAKQLWEDRPALPDDQIEIHPLKFAGETTTSKLSRLRKELLALHAEGTIVSQLDEIAWLCNLRGKDVHCNPVFVSYMIVTQQNATLYISPKKVTEEVKAYLKEQNILLKEYEEILDDLKLYPQPSLMIDPSTSNWELIAHLPEACHLVEHSSIIAPMKAIKNETEIQGYRNAMLRDGIAMVKFLHWLETALRTGQETELSVDKKLTSLRAQQPLYRDISFDTIAGYGPHGAIVHYEATSETDIPLEPHGLLLLDSGAQYQDGTTDITRTIALGPLSEQEKIDYTLVLRGHIRLAMCKFPAGSSGTQIDACARYAMWQEGVNFLHGTGHGVGSYLNVHEGPHQIRMNYMPAPLCANMTVTDEPGIYRAGSHGVRIENTMLITPYLNNEFGEFLQLEALTLCPIDKTPIVHERMQTDEIQYLNEYHQRVYRELAPHLNDEEKAWLKKACAAL